MMCGSVHFCSGTEVGTAETCGVGWRCYGKGSDVSCHVVSSFLTQSASQDGHHTSKEDWKNVVTEDLLLKRTSTSWWRELFTRCLRSGSLKPRCSSQGGGLPRAQQVSALEGPHISGRKCLLGPRALKRPLLIRPKEPHSSLAVSSLSLERTRPPCTFRCSRSYSEEVTGTRHMDLIILLNLSY